MARTGGLLRVREERTRTAEGQNTNKKAGFIVAALSACNSLRLASLPVIGYITVTSTVSA
jgi:hypothetical protein